MGDDPIYYDPEEWPPREEPDCYRCSDVGTVPAHLLPRRCVRRCPWCDPSRLDRLLAAVSPRRRWRDLRRALRGPMGSVEEPPF